MIHHRGLVRIDFRRRGASIPPLPGFRRAELDAAPTIEDKQFIAHCADHLWQENLIHAIAIGGERVGCIEEVIANANEHARRIRTRVRCAHDLRNDEFTRITEGPQESGIGHLLAIHPIGPLRGLLALVAYEHGGVHDVHCGRLHIETRDRLRIRAHRRWVNEFNRIDTSTAGHHLQRNIEHPCGLIAVRWCSGRRRVPIAEIPCELHWGPRCGSVRELHGQRHAPRRIGTERSDRCRIQVHRIGVLLGATVVGNGQHNRIVAGRYKIRHDRIALHDGLHAIGPKVPYNGGVGPENTQRIQLHRQLVHAQGRWCNERRVDGREHLEGRCGGIGAGPAGLYNKRDGIGAGVGIRP